MAQNVSFVSMRVCFFVIFLFQKNGYGKIKNCFLRAATRSFA